MTRWERLTRIPHSAWDGQAAVRSAVRHRLGYRGLMLMMFGLMYICIGLAVINANDYRPELVHTHLPLLFRVFLWVIPGVVAVTTALDDKWQALGYGLLFIPPAERAVSYAIAVVTVPTWTRVPAVLIYLLILLTIMFCASWPEPVEVEQQMQNEVHEQHFASLLSEDTEVYRDQAGRLHDPADEARGAEQ